jgi:hypothetical protein
MAEETPVITVRALLFLARNALETIRIRPWIVGYLAVVVFIPPVTDNQPESVNLWNTRLNLGLNSRPASYPPPAKPPQKESSAVRLPRRHALIVASLIAISCIATLIVIAAGGALVDRTRSHGVSGPVAGGDVRHVPVVVVPMPEPPPLIQRPAVPRPTPAPAPPALTLIGGEPPQQSAGTGGRAAEHGNGTGPRGSAGGGVGSGGHVGVGPSPNPPPPCPSPDPGAPPIPSAPPIVSPSGSPPVESTPTERPTPTVGSTPTGSPSGQASSGAPTGSTPAPSHPGDAPEHEMHGPVTAALIDTTTFVGASVIQLVGRAVS